MDGSKSSDPDNDIVTYKWSILGTDEIILNGIKGMYNFKNTKTDLNQNIILTVTDSNGLKSQDTIMINIINDEAPIANAGEDFIAPYNKYVQLDLSLIHI